MGAACVCLNREYKEDSAVEQEIGGDDAIAPPLRQNVSIAEAADNTLGDADDAASPSYGESNAVTAAAIGEGRGEADAPADATDEETVANGDSTPSPDKLPQPAPAAAPVRKPVAITAQQAAKKLSAVPERPKEAPTPTRFMKLQPLEPKVYNFTLGIARATKQGLYLVYDEGNTGSWKATWSSELIPNAWMLAVPPTGTTVPPHKLKKATLLGENIHTKKPSYYGGVMEYLKEAFRYKATVFLMPEFGRTEQMEVSGADTDAAATRADLFPAMAVAVLNKDSSEVKQVGASGGVKLAECCAAISIPSKGRGAGKLAAFLVPGTRVPMSTFTAVGRDDGGASITF